MPERSNIRVPNQDARLQDLITQMLQQADRMGAVSFSLRAEPFWPAARAFENIASCMRAQANELRKHLILTILAEDHTP
ncbi:hypothetical protein NBRC3299_0476 [Acetobacter pasteurianus NBRC 3299]|nr:hypothetical protein NBRC3299_0476 [Acetobacter pasteurianus NBRC 3299]